MIVRLVFGGAAVARHDEFEVVHVGVLRREEHAEIAGDAGEDQRLRFEVRKQHIERGGVETGVLGLEDELILLVGCEELRNRAAAHLVMEAVLE